MQTDPTTLRRVATEASYMDRVAKASRRTGLSANARKLEGRRDVALAQGARNAGVDSQTFGAMLRPLFESERADG